MSRVKLHELSKHYGAAAAVDGVNLEVAQGEMVALLGPSGCGKTTTLRMVAGFVPATAGDIFFDDRKVTELPPHRRNAGMVFQSYALFPHLSVAQNVAYGLQMRKVPEAEQQRRVKEALEWVRVAPFADRLPKQLSGGQQQRVALARALVIQPDVLLLDEPLSNLDAKLRLEVRNEIRRLQQRAGITSMFVTHDQEEAMAIADRIAVMEAGRLVQLGSAESLYRRPASRFVAGFIGKCNFLEGRVLAPGQFEAAAGERLAFSGPGAPGAAAFCIRPEHLVLCEQALPGGRSLAARLVSLTYLGPITELEASTAAGERLLAHLPSTAGLSMQPGQALHLGWPEQQAFVVA